MSMPDKIVSVCSFDLPPPKPTGNIFTGWASLTNCIVGAGMLGLAHAIAKTGWVLGLTAFFTFGLLSLFSLHLINATCMNMPDRRLTYFTSCVAAGVPKLTTLVDVLLVLNNIGINTASLQIFASMGMQLLEFWCPGSTADNHFVIRLGLIILVLLLLAPVCFMKSISSTAITNAIGLTFFVYVIVTGFVYCVAHGEPSGTDSLGPAEDVWSILAVLPVFIFCFSCHFNMYSVAEDTIDRTQKKLDVTSTLANLSVLAVFIPAMCAPYYVFGSEVNSNFYLSLPLSNVSIHIGYILLPFAVLTAYPLLLFPARTSLNNIISRFVPQHRDSSWLHISLTTYFMICTAVLSIVFQDLGVTLALVGIISTNTLSFVVPTFVYCKMFNTKRDRVWYMSAALCVISIVLFPVCLAGLVYTLF